MNSAKRQPDGNGMPTYERLRELYGPSGVVPVSTKRLFKYPAFKHPGEFE
jgi:hypothetical protein